MIRLITDEAIPQRPKIVRRSGQTAHRYLITRRPSDRRRIAEFFILGSDTMEIINPIHFKNRNDLTVGELIVMDVGSNSVLGIVVEIKNDGDGTLIVLRGERFALTPTLYTTEMSHTVLSYGKNWVLEITPGEETFGRNFQNSPSAVVIDEKRLGMRVVRADPYNVPVVLDLETIQSFSPGMYSAPVENWCIWASREDRENSRSAPVFVSADLKKAANGSGQEE